MTEASLHHITCAGLPAQHADASATHHRMAYWEWHAASADPSHVVVCVHGLTRQSRDFDTLAAALAPRVRVLSVDIVGRGHSDWLKDPAGYQIATYAADMLMLLAQLRARGATRIDWVGTSMGGLIGMAVAGSQPEAVARLVLNDVGPALEAGAIARIGSYVGTAPQFNTVQRAADYLWSLSTGFGPHTPEQWLALSRPMLSAIDGDDGAPARWRLHYDPAIALPLRAATPESAQQGEAMLWQLYDNIRARTLLLRGAESDLLSPATALAMTQRGPKPRCVEFAGVGHAPTLVAPDQVRVVSEFLLDGA